MRSTGLFLVLALLVAPTLAGGETVISRSSYWVGNHSMIMSDVVVERDDGSRETLTVPGGSVNGIGMVQFHIGRGLLSNPRRGP